MSESETDKPPRYMAQLLEELGWNQGTRIPLADSLNQELETLLIKRQNEIQSLKEALTLQNQKHKDLNNYKDQVTTEYQENTRLLFAHKAQLEQEVKLKQIYLNEAISFERTILDNTKENKEVSKRIDRIQASTARLLKKADSLKTEVCGERGAVQEWRAALERSACDITAIEQYTKQDLSKAKAMEMKRIKLKVEHDRMQERLNQIVSNLNAEERACQRISEQVKDGMEQRKQMMNLWTGAVENLRQRDTDIRHIREDYAVLEAESNKMADLCREQQLFCDQQKGNNDEATRANMGLSNQLSQLRMYYQTLYEENLTLDSEAQSLQREVSNVKLALEKLHMENRQIMEDQRKKDLALKTVNEKLRDLKEKLKESLDKNKSSEKRARELEDILNEEERYASQITANQQRAMHCSFVEQKNLLTLKNDEKLFNMQIKAFRAIMSKLNSKQKSIERDLQSQKETYYSIVYQVETYGAQVSHMEGSRAEREFSAELVEKENRLKDVCVRHAARLALLERHSAHLIEDMRRYTREIDVKSLELKTLESRLKSAMLNVEGGDKDLIASRDIWKKMRVEEALMRLRVAHAARAVAGLEDTAFTLQKQQLQLDAAMNERIVEIGVRRDMFNVQKRALMDDCGKLRCEIRERESRIDQLKKRYEIFMASLGKDETGQQLTATFFKIKFAAERAELRARGASLDADIGRRERDISALEATIRVVQAAHAHFLHHISPIPDDAPEIEELNSLMDKYYKTRDTLKGVHMKILTLEKSVANVGSRLVFLNDQTKQLTARESDTQNDLEGARERLNKQETCLNNARDIVKHNSKRAQKLVEGVDQWRIFQLAVWIRDFDESVNNAIHALADLCASPPAAQHLAALMGSMEIESLVPKNQRRLRTFVNKIVSDGAAALKGVTTETDMDAETVFSSSIESSHSGLSIASGYTRRLTSFRKSLAPKIEEPTLISDIPEIGKYIESSNDRRQKIIFGAIAITISISTSGSGKLKNAMSLVEGAGRPMSSCGLLSVIMIMFIPSFHGVPSCGDSRNRIRASNGRCEYA